LDDLKERRGYSHLKEEALVRPMWRARFGGGFGPVVRYTTYIKLPLRNTGKENKIKTPAQQGDQNCNYRKKKEWQWHQEHARTHTGVQLIFGRCPFQISTRTLITIRQLLPYNIFCGFTQHLCRRSGIEPKTKDGHCTHPSQLIIH